MIEQPTSPRICTVSLSDISDINREEILKLERHDDQVDFMPDVASSLHGLEKYPDARPLTISSGETLVGFALIGIDENTGNWKIFRLLIDKRYQGKGYGKKALGLIIEELRQTQGVSEVLICYHERNEIARRMYLSFGFKEYEINDTKISAKLRL